VIESDLHLAFPEFPDPIQNDVQIVQFDEETKIVSMPLWYWLAITDYVNYVRQEEAIYNSWVKTEK
jgi:hypothetical protein